VEEREEKESLRVRKFGAQIRALLEARGWNLPAGLRADLSVMGGTVEGHLGMSVLAGVAGLFAPTVMFAPAVYFFGASISSPVWLALLGVLVGAALPTLQLRGSAKERRRDFRHVVSSFLDLVSMNLAGGRGVPEALQSAVSLSNGWGMVRIRETLQNARLQGITPWEALGDLGAELAVEELRDMAAALALVAEDGAKVRESLSARAASMRQRELADAEGRAAARSQSMLVAQLLLCVGFLLFLIYPPISEILGF
jgi:Flp pilus assembly protein TadB